MNRTFTKRAGVGEPGVVTTFEETGQYDLELDAAVTRNGADRHAVV